LGIGREQDSDIGEGGVLVNRTKQVCLLFVALFVAQLAVIPSVSAASEWYNTSWIYRIEVTLDNDKAGNATQTDFPIVLTENNVPALFWDGVESDGTDVVVTSADGTTKLKRELVAGSWSVASETMELHVKIPSYSHTADTIIYLYYGNSAGAETNDTDTWDSDFEFVSHMNDYNSATQIFDSTVNANHGTKGATTQAPTEVAGEIGKAQQFVKADLTYIDFTPITMLRTAATFMSFLTLDEEPTSAYGDFIVSGGVVAFKYIGFDQYRRIKSESNTNSDSWSIVGGQVVLSTPVVIALSADTLVTTYLNDGVYSTKTPVNDLTVSRMGISTDGNAVVSISMTLCELRISSSARSAEWIAATNSWLRDNTNCYSMGEQETYGDMSKATYDADDDGIVDKAASVDDGAGNSETAAAVTAVVTEVEAVNGSIVGSDDGFASGNLTAGIQAAKIFAWKNETGGSVIVQRVIINATTASTPAAKINVGQSAADAASDNLIDGAALDSIDSFDNIDSQGTNGQSTVVVADDEYITGYEDNSAASTDLVGKYYVYYTAV